MQLPPFLQRNKAAPPAPQAAPSVGDENSPVQVARARARRRLLGAVVLLAVGIVGFPLVFETQPRQMPLDVRIDTPDSRATAVASAEAPTGTPQRAPALVQPPPANRAATEPPAQPALPAPPPLDELPPEAATAAAPPAPSAASAAAGRPASAGVTPAPQATAANDGARAKALLDGADAASQPKANRFIVQVGAYSDGNALRDARQKVEKLGLKTYTQVVDSEGGQRTRVRVGPFSTRDEADRASARLRSAGLPVAVLVL